MQDVIQFFQSTIGVALLIFLAYFPLIDFIRRLYLYEFELYRRLEQAYRPIIKFVLLMQTIVFLLIYVILPYVAIKQYMVAKVNTLLVLPVTFLVLSNIAVFVIYGAIKTGKIKVTLKKR
ncbi:hypothetical protein ACQUY5_28335 [Bacillus cereus]|uniref:hypothetical protein n=1 Tax=Bacillus cereus TaxID=1396 RepID=UPI003D1737B1